MALIKCPQCGKPISDRAARCPHCGIDTPATQMGSNYNTSQPGVYINQHENHRTGSNRKQWLWVLVPLLLLAGVITGFVLWNNNQNKAYELEQARQDSIAAAITKQARQDSIAAIEQARQDSITAEKARQDSIAAEKTRGDFIDKWDFFTADEIDELMSHIEKNPEPASYYRAFCERHGMALRKQDFYNNNRGYSCFGARNVDRVKSEGGGTFFIPTGNSPCYIEINLTGYDGGKYFYTRPSLYFVIGFPSKEKRDMVYRDLISGRKFETYVSSGLEKSESKGIYEIIWQNEGG